MQPGYLPWLGYFDQVALADVFVFYDDVQYDKHGWRNRNRLLARGAPQWLTVPVSHGGRFGQSVRDARIADPAFATRHVRTIRQLYGRASAFETVFPAIETYLLGRRWEWLVDLCVEGHHLIAGMLGLATPVRFARDIGHFGLGRTERLVAICQDLGATRYIAANASRDYMNEALWRDARITLVYQDYVHPTYPQPSSPFVSHLSVLDALMHVTPEKVRAFVGVSHGKLRAPGSDHVG
jgi:hypothetical protein